MRVIHLSAECFPAAKVGGLADVVGALPKYTNQSGIETAVVMPRFRTKWTMKQRWESRFDGDVQLDGRQVWFSIQECVGSVEALGFRLFAIDVPGMFDRDGIYADTATGHYYTDDTERMVVFQRAALQWMRQFAVKPAVIHCHDHHTGLVPFMVKYCPEFSALAQVPTVFTIHNGNYQGAFSWSKAGLLPPFYASARGMLDWADTINALASGIKNSWACTTVSPGYLEELKHNSGGVEWLVRNEWHKMHGILNGIDTDVWNPATDPMLPHNLQKGDVEAFKKANKAAICQWFGLNPNRPLITYIGRFAGEKGAGLLPDAIKKFIHEGGPATFFVLGNGQPYLEDVFRRMRAALPGAFGCALEYNESLSHALYAGSDFLVMPSKVEPCGLNQMYAMRYGTVPVVRSVGGLIDTVRDVDQTGGWGIRFDHFNTDALYHAFVRAVAVYSYKGNMAALRKRMMAIDNSWERSAQHYRAVYQKLGLS